MLLIQEVLHAICNRVLNVNIAVNHVHVIVGSCPNCDYNNLIKSASLIGLSVNRDEYLQQTIIVIILLFAFLFQIRCADWSGRLLLVLVTLLTYL